MNVSNPRNALTKFFRRFHTIMFFLIVSGGLFVAIVVIIMTVAKSGETAINSDQAINGSFDEATINQIKNDLKTPSKPGKRPSPFVE